MNLVDIEKVFEINKNYSIETEYVGKRNSKIITIDNFYKNPEEVRQFAISSPASKGYCLNGSSPGYRARLLVNLRDLQYHVHEIIRKEYDYTEEFREKDLHFMTNIFYKEMKVSHQNIVPHIDSICNFAASVFLNHDEECVGGTAFFRYVTTDIESFPTSIWSYTKEKHDIERVKNLLKLSSDKEIQEYIHNSFISDEYMTETNEVWELYYKILSKFNRLVLYESNLFHSLYMRPEWYRDNYRISQVMFI